MLRFFCVGFGSGIGGRGTMFEITMVHDMVGFAEISAKLMSLRSPAPTFRWIIWVLELFVLTTRIVESMDFSIRGGSY